MTTEDVFVTLKEFVPNIERIPLSKQENSNNATKMQTKESRRLTGNTYVLEGTQRLSVSLGAGWGH